MPPVTRPGAPPPGGCREGTARPRTHRRQADTQRGCRDPTALPPPCAPSLPEPAGPLGPLSWLGGGEAMSENTGLISPRALGPGLGMCNGLLRALLVHFAQLGLLQRPRRRCRGHLPSGSSLRHYQLLQTASCLRHRLPSPRRRPSHLAWLLCVDAMRAPWPLPHRGGCRKGRRGEGGQGGGRGEGGGGGEREGEGAEGGVGGAGGGKGGNGVRGEGATEQGQKGARTGLVHLGEGWGALWGLGGGAGGFGVVRGGRSKRRGRAVGG